MAQICSLSKVVWEMLLSSTKRDSEKVSSQEIIKKFYAFSI